LFCRSAKEKIKYIFFVFFPELYTTHPPTSSKTWKKEKIKREKAVIINNDEEDRKQKHL
jgi:hypothetical protein